MKRLPLFSVVLLSGLSMLACGGRQTARNSVKNAEALYAFTVELSDSALRVGISDTLPLGRMREGEVISQTIGIRNLHDAPIVILGIETSCGCTTVEYPKHPIMPGTTEGVSFRFDSRGEYGRQFKSFRILTSIDDNPYKVYITGEVL